MVFSNVQIMAISMAVFILWMALMLLKVEAMGVTYVMIGKIDRHLPRVTMIF